MALVIPLLLEHEYQQHRNLDFFGLSETFEGWRDREHAYRSALSRNCSPGCEGGCSPWELEEWARRKGRTELLRQAPTSLSRKGGPKTPTPLIETSARALLDPLSPDAARTRQRQVVASPIDLPRPLLFTVARTIRVEHDGKLHARSPLARRLSSCLHRSPPSFLVYEPVFFVQFVPATTPTYGQRGVCAALAEVE